MLVSKIHAISQAIYHLFVIAGAGFRYQDIPYESCDGKCGKVQVSFLQVLRVSSVSILSPTLHTHPHIDLQVSVTRTNGRSLE